MQPYGYPLYIASLAVASVLIILAGGLWIGSKWYDEWSGLNASMKYSDGYCSVAVVKIQGNIIPYQGADRDGLTSSADLPPATDPDSFDYAFRLAENDPNVYGILVEINSYGGYPVASQTIAERIKSSSLPVLALIREAGDSGAYLAASAADHIIASPLSEVGSIGITMSYVQNAAQNDKDGREFISLASGPFKDAGSPDKPLTKEERELFERDIKIYHDLFVEEVAKNRNMPKEKIASLADGSVMPGALALENGLVDDLGSLENARSWFAEQFGWDRESVWFCP